MFDNQNIKIDEGSASEATKKEYDDLPAKPSTIFVKTPPSSPNMMSKLMQEIRTGVPLKKVEPIKHQTLEVMTNLMKALGITWNDVLLFIKLAQSMK